MNRLLKWVLLLCSITVLQTANSQSLASVLEVAEKSMSSKNFYDAFVKYQEALEFEPENNLFRYKAALAGIQFGAYKQAGDLLQLVLDSEEKNKFPEASLKLGQMRQIQGHYDQAILAYNIYKTEYSTDSSPYLKLVDREIQACQWAIGQQNTPNKGITFWRLENNINSPFSDFAPFAAGDTFYYSSLRFDNTYNTSLPKKHVASVLKSLNGQEPLRLFNDSFPGKGLSLAHSSFSKEGNWVYYTLCEDLNDHDKRCDLYKSRVASNGQWTNAEKLPDFINVPGFSSTQPCYVSTHEEGSDILFFASNRPGQSKGGYDIWYTRIDQLGQCSEPVNCMEINTAEDEFSPFYYEKAKLLYFASKGHLGFGGLDIYKSKWTEKGFSVPANIGAPQNSSFDDLYYFVHPSDTIAYLASNRTGTLFLDDASEACCLDIFRLSIAPCDVKLLAQVFNYYNQEPILGATVDLYDLDEPSSPPLTTTLPNDYNFAFDIVCERNYRLVAHKEGFSNDTVQFNSGKPGEFKSITKKLFLKPTQVTLELLTYNKNNLDTLNGVTVRIKDLDGTLDTTVMHELRNQYFIPAIPCHRYQITASKPEFATIDSIITIDCSSSGIIQKKLYLPTILFSFLPLSLYFDNDRPNPNNWDTITKSFYSTTFKTYFAKKSEFIKINHELQAFDKIPVDTSMEHFFFQKVKYGKERLDSFMIILEKDLKRGKKYEIFLKGYASPLAKTNYNLNLSNRRIHSVYNEILGYKNGLLKKYIKNGQLKLSQKPFGESNAPSGISDQKKDLRSVYSIEASQERRVEIIEIKE